MHERRDIVLSRRKVVENLQDSYGLGHRRLSGVFAEGLLCLVHRPHDISERAFDLASQTVVNGHCAGESAEFVLGQRFLSVLQRVGIDKDILDDLDCRPQFDTAARLRQAAQ